MPPTMSAQQFVNKWKNVTTTERASAQSHFIDLCSLLREQNPLDADPTGNNYAFERGAAKGVGPTKGSHGWADVWKRNCFAWEYKKGGADLDKAYAQLLQYREALDNPPLLVVSDMHTIQAHTNITNTAKQIYIWTLDDLLNPARLDQLRRVWTEPFALKPTITTAQVTETAAKEFAKLAELLRKWGEPADKAAHFLIRILFCLFAEDVDLLPNGLFSKLVDRTRARSQDFSQQLRFLFDAMRTGGMFALENIAYFNGGLFDNADVINLDSDGLGILYKVSGLDWSSIEPSILGTLFERSLDPAKRSQLGAHYTSRDDILLIVEPVLMAPLRRQWADVQARANELITRRDAASGGQRTRLDNELQALLLGFQGRIAGTRVLDPACGSGNFLYVALKQLLDLEKEVIVFIGDAGFTRPFPMVSPEQLRGIELNEYAHELAQITVWIGYIQWLRDNGFGQPSEPILKPLNTIVQMDAILAYDADGRPVKPSWPEADVIVGNPPFLGGKKLRAQLGLAYVNNLYVLYGGSIPKRADLVCYWFERAREYIAQHRTGRAGLLATQAIRMGDSNMVLERIKQDGDIFMAWSDRPWVLDGAAVRVSMVGFDHGSEKERYSDGALVPLITSSLTSGFAVSALEKLNENERLSFQGVIQRGDFHIPNDVAQRMLAHHGNPNGRPNSDVIRPLLNGDDVTKRSRNVYVVDFGKDMPLAEAAMYEAPFELVKQQVYAMRQKANQASAREKWWIHWNPRPGMRHALRPLQRYIVTPAVSKHRMFVWVSTSVLPDHRLCAFARDDNYFFGVLHSRVHELWALTTSSRHGVGNDPTYNNTTCFKTFPLPWVPGAEPKDDPRVEAIAEAARELVEKRDRWLNPEGADEATLKKRTLTNLYNERPTWLDLAHRKLDHAALDAYGWTHDISDEEILTRLLALNLERAEAQGGVALAAGVAASEDDE